jgi:FAD/FMN-containing dehydrogenase
MTLRVGEGIDAFRATFKGQVTTPGHSDYDRQRALWNGVIDKRPAIIASCTTAQHVADAILYARRNGLTIAVRGGGHNYAGHAVCDDGMMIHLGAMNGVRVDPDKRRVVCGGGATWAELDAATQQHGLATPGGFISHTGVGGLTLGGGIGWLTKKAGLTIDNLLSAEVVTADGKVVRASPQDHADLFWALRGGGGNFGVVTSFELALHAVGPIVHLGFFFFDLQAGSDALRFSRDFIKTLPDDATAFHAIGLSAPPAPFVPEQHRFRLGHALLVVGFGSAEEHARVVAPIRQSVRPLFEHVTPIPFVALQQMFNESVIWGSFAYEKALYLDELSDGAIAVIAEHVPKRTSPLAFAPVFALRGKYCEVDDAATAFGGKRSPGFVFNIHVATPMREHYEADRMWVRRFWQALGPHASGTGSYVNFLSDGGEDRVRASYGAEKYARLARIKGQWDPENVFHLNANIKPA